MLRSVRRIGNALLIVSVLSVSLGMLSSVSALCSQGGTECFAAAFSALGNSQPEYTWSAQTAQSTPLHGIGLIGETGGVDMWTVFQMVSGYALLTAVLILIVLECLELHYLRKLFHYRKAFRIR